jgi:hypothetical protein
VFSIYRGIGLAVGEGLVVPTAGKASFKLTIFAALLHERVRVWLALFPRAGAAILFEQFAGTLGISAAEGAERAETLLVFLLWRH